MKNQHATILLLLSMIVGQLFAQVPTPESVFGFQVGADYKLADYDQMLDYYDQLDAASPRVQKIEIGKSVLGKPLLLLFISSEANLANLEKYRQINEGIARAKIEETLARQYAKEGKAIIWIDAGLHANERACAQMISELAWRVATEESDEMQKIRDEVIFLCMPVMNPDGLDIIVDWYRQHLGTPHETTNPAWLYHHYVGHDNNRDWFMNNIPESYHVNEVLYNEWYPQIVYNQHQTGPSWTRIFVPPFADPVNPNIHPGITTATNVVGTAMTNRFAMENMPGVVSQVQYSMWWNGGMRTVPYFHNMIGILTETSHRSPTPIEYPPSNRPKQVGERRGGIQTDAMRVFYPYPWKGGTSHFRDAVDYMITGSMAVLDYAADRKEDLLFNMYQMGRDAIEGKLLNKYFAYVIPQDQWDASEARNLINILRQGGIEVNQATASFQAGGQTYPSGTFIIYTAQAFRPYLRDMMEEQHYPDKRAYPEGPPIPPYDLAGWTLPYQMGVEVNRIESAFEAPTTVIETRVPIPTYNLGNAPSFNLSCRSNAAYGAVNTLLANGATVHRVPSSTKETNAGDFIVTGPTEVLQRAVNEWGVSLVPRPSDGRPTGPSLKQPKVGLYKSWVANMDEGWTRWVLDEYAFNYDTLHNKDIQNLALDAYDVIIIPDQSVNRILNGHLPGFMPEPYTGGIGLEGTLKLKQFVEAGGTLITFDEASDYAIEQFGLPIRNVVSGKEDTEFFIPGSLIRTNIDTDHPLAFGMKEEVAASFNRSRAYQIVSKSKRAEGGTETTVKDAPIPNIEIIASYAEDHLLMSGWALNEKRYIGGKAAMLSAPVGEGQVVLFGFRPQFRGQPRGTYKLVFNALMN